MKLVQVFARAIVRRVAAVLVACVFAFIAQCAHAQYEGCLDPLSVNAFCQDEGMANLGANKVADRIISGNPTQGLTKCAPVYSVSQNYQNATNIRIPIIKSGMSCSSPFSSGNRAFPNTATCAARAARNSNLIKESDANSGSMCDNGCKAELTDVALDMSISGPVSSTGSLMQGTIKPTGQTCNDPNFPDEPMICHAVNGGYQVCLKPNKDMCVKTPRGKTYCWTPADQGPKANDDRRDGGVKSPPNTQPRPPQNREGEDWQEGGRGTVTDNNGGGTTTVVGVVNNGTPNTGTPVPGDGAGGGSGDGGDGDGDDDDGSASGGGDCSAPPVCSGDAIMCAVLDQQWRTRCAGDADNDGQPDWTKVEGDGTDGAGEDPEKPHKNVGLNLGLLDNSGFGLGRSCPQLGTLDLGQFGVINLDEIDWVCKFCQVVFGILSLLGAFIAYRVLAGE